MVRRVVSSQLQFARTAGCELIAEGVETEGEHDTLLDLGVALGQGYLYARPSPLQIP